MKSLQEVIKAKECCANDSEDCEHCPYVDIHDTRLICCEKRYDDEQFYLKQYAENAENIFRMKIDLQKKIERFQNAYIMLIHELANLEDNPPLSWDELRLLKGKPVWVECKYYRQWAIIGEINDDYEIIKFYGFRLYAPEDKSTMGDDWQAYRKER